MGGHRLFYLSLGLIAVAIISTQVSAYYYLQRLYNAGPSRTGVSCSNLISSGSQVTVTSVVVNTLINYGNRTLSWYNRTTVPADWNFYDLTLYLTNCNVEAKFYGPPLNEHYMAGINGLREAGGFYWTLWVYCPSAKAWAVPPVGADLIRLQTGQVLAWYYQNTSGGEASWSPPEAGARRVGTC